MMLDKPQEKKARRKTRFLGATLGLLSALFYVSAFPAGNVPEAAYIFAVPLLVWFFMKPPWGRTVLILECVGIAVWLWLLVWLRHVSVGGWIGLSVVLGQFFVLWFLLARWSLPRIAGASGSLRLLTLCGLAGAWVLLEWMRTWVFSGFPWLPLAASQWQRPVVLQVLAWTGFYGLSFLLIFFNLGLASYGQFWWRVRSGFGERRLCVEFYVAVFLLAGTLGLFFFSVLQGKEQDEGLLRVGVVQPYTPARLKWDPKEAQENWQVLQRFTEALGHADIDWVLWPESATPLPVIGNQSMCAWVEALASEAKKPIVMGNLAREPDGWYNGIFVVLPHQGLVKPYYIKRKLVPFGEYVPLRSWLPGLEKVVPIGDDFLPGGEAELLKVPLGDGDILCGGLVCYEDIFPQLAREVVRKGARCFIVVTNDAWYGEEAGAYQHAAHSVLRAVETRRPVVRSGNGGWSGWIDGFGYIREVLMQAGRGVYFRGAESLSVHYPLGEDLKQSFYVRWGDWFVALSAVLCLSLLFVRRLDP